ncbi:hypothetical protein [Undibacter mobilis]|uniref:Uncharacterized protein n=1 Tax=Undibacter mobilis TaxID=2292256 RepID=A0A371B321_9BRAD|nr:hypothetical protein [Undibacter mobilis]RDV01861.1 hypothetical protein DXH78_14660 [Undibacter mobilis]
MRFIIGFLSGILGALAGWFALAMLVMALAGPDRDGGVAMGAFFNIGPIGGVIGFVAGVLLYLKFGMTAEAPADAGVAGPSRAPKRKRVSRPFAIVVVAVLALLAWGAWYELIRSPYMTRGFMTLELQFRLPSGMSLPADPTGVHIAVKEGSQTLEPALGPAWQGTDEGRPVIRAHVTLSLKTGARSVTLALPGVQQQTWPIDLPRDPGPTPGYAPWQLASGRSEPKIEMNFRLSADR